MNTDRSYLTAPLGTFVGHRVFVTRLPFMTNPKDLFAAFCHYGAVRSTKVIMANSGETRGYGFVNYSSENEARQLLYELSRKVIN